LKIFVVRVSSHTKPGYQKPRYQKLRFYQSCDSNQKSPRGVQLHTMKGLFGKEKEAQNENKREDKVDELPPPPPYSENDLNSTDEMQNPEKLQANQGNQGYQQGQQAYQQGLQQGQQAYQQGYQQGEQAYQQGFQGSQGNYPGQSYQFGGPGYDANQDPNVYTVPPQLVNISQANPAHLNPAYQQYLRRDAERVQQGDIPKGRENFKHGAPLNPGTVNKNKKSSGGFPGAKGGATYNNAANR
jgi:hypothetical protein